MTAVVVVGDDLVTSAKTRSQFQVQCEKWTLPVCEPKDKVVLLHMPNSNSDVSTQLLVGNIKYTQETQTDSETGIFNFDMQ